MCFKAVEDAVSALLQALQHDQDAEVRKGAILALGSIGSMWCLSDTSIEGSKCKCSCFCSTGIRFYRHNLSRSTGSSQGISIPTIIYADTFIKPACAE